MQNIFAENARAGFILLLRRKDVREIIAPGQFAKAGESSQHRARNDGRKRVRQSRQPDSDHNEHRAMSAIKIKSWGDCFHSSRPPMNAANTVSGN